MSLEFANAVFAAIEMTRPSSAASGGSGSSGGSGGSTGGTLPPSTPTSSTGKLDTLRVWLKQEDLWRNWFAFPVICEVAIALISAAVCFLPLFGGYRTEAPLVGTVRPWLLVFFGLNVWLFAWWKTLKPDQIGYKTFLGRCVQRLGKDGPVLEPPGLFNVVILPGLQFGIQFGARETTSTRQLLEEGFISKGTLEQCGEILRVNFSAPETAKFTLDKQEEDDYANGKHDVVTRVDKRKKDYETDPLNNRLTGEIRVTLLARIDPDMVFEFARNIGNLDRAVRELDESGSTE